MDRLNELGDRKQTPLVRIVAFIARVLLGFCRFSVDPVVMVRGISFQKRRESWKGCAEEAA